MPNDKELRFMAYSTLAYGGRGIAYFLYWGPTMYGGLYRDGKPMPVMSSVVQLNSEIAALSSELMKLKSVGVYHTDPLPNGTKRIPANSPVRIMSKSPLLLGLFTDQMSAQSFMVVNRDYRSNEVADISIPKGCGVMEFHRSDNAWRTLITTTAPTFRLGIGAGDGRLFKIMERPR
jgi:hypothetical protein